MTALANEEPGFIFGDLLTTTNNGGGLNTTLNQLQDGNGNASTVTIATNAINFSRGGGNTFQLDGVALTASAANINEVCAFNGSSPGAFTINGALIVGGGFVAAQRLLTGPINYNVVATDYYILTNALGPINIVLPSPVLTPDLIVVIKDIGNASGLNPITITVSGGILIDGNAAHVINAAFGKVQLAAGGGGAANEWYIIGT